MPYKNIVFVKLEKRLLNDPRWWTMSEQAQLIYIKLILLAAETYNKIPLNDNVLREALRSKLELKPFQEYLREVATNFPKLKQNKHFRYFAEFETKTNYIPKQEIPRKSQGLPKVVTDKDKEEDKDKEKEIEAKFSFLTNKDFKKVFSEYLEMRVKIRKPATNPAKVLALTELHKHDLETAIKMLENSILHSWQGVFPLKDKREAGSNLTKVQRSNLQGLSKTMERINNDKQSISTGICGPDGSVSGVAV